MRNFLLIATVKITAVIFTAGAAPVHAADVPTEAIAISAATAELAAELQTGSLLFTEGDCLAIRVYTASPYTHVAIVVVTDEEPIVYDSMNGIGVRRLPLEQYLQTESPHSLHVFHPSRPLTAEQGNELEEYLASQLGRPYDIHHHLTGQRADGLHCSEYATDALMSIGLLRANRPSKVSPASLVTGITRAEIYNSSQTIELVAPLPPEQPASNRCHKLWLDTKRCTMACCEKLSGWLLCR